MKVLYIECAMGAAGDMLTAALSEITGRETAAAALAKAGIPGVEYCFEDTSKCGIKGTHVRVKIEGREEEPCGEHEHHHEHGSEHRHDHEGGHHHHDQGHEHDHDHHHEHHSLSDITEIIAALDVPDNVRSDAEKVYGIIASAESEVHDRPVDQIHFHEVGSMDAVADVTAVCLLLDMIKADKIIVSPVNTGGGTVKCAHGILPVPAPATALILKGIPYYEGNIKSELCTPTGAALLKYFAAEFGPRPLMKVDRIGYGFGKKDFEQANCVRVFYGETEGTHDTVVQLSCNIDDMTGEEIGYAFEKLLACGARDVYVTPALMKKSRPGNVLNVIVSPEMKDEAVRCIFKHTTTLGVRSCVMQRDVLARTEEVRRTSYGDVRVKRSSGYGVDREKAEYDDLRSIADDRGESILDIKRDLNNAK